MVVHSREVRLKSASLLAELRQAHESVFRAMEELDRLTHGEVPSREFLSDARWKLSKASMARRILWGRILAHLAPLVDRDAQTNLRRLQQLDFDMLRASSAHVGTWTIEAASVRWRGYCEASRDIRRKMAAGIAQEKRVLYPIMQALRVDEQRTCVMPPLQGLRSANGH